MSENLSAFAYLLSSICFIMPWSMLTAFSGLTITLKSVISPASFQRIMSMPLMWTPWTSAVNSSIASESPMTSRTYWNVSFANTLAAAAKYLDAPYQTSRSRAPCSPYPTM